MLESHFGPSRVARELPEPLWSWVRSRIEAACDASRLGQPPVPFAAERSGTRLLVHFVRLARQPLLLLEETARPAERLRMALINQGKVPEAKTQLQQYLKLAPTGQHAETAKSILGSI